MTHNCNTFDVADSPFKIKYHYLLHRLAVEVWLNDCANNILINNNDLGEVLLDLVAILVKLKGFTNTRAFPLVILTSRYV